MSSRFREALDRTLLLCRDRDIIGTNDPSDEQLVAAFMDTRVVVVADEANLSSASGQHALVALINLVGRLGIDLTLSIPEVPMRGNQPPIRGPWLRAGLIELGGDLLPDWNMRASKPDAPTDVALVLGDSPYSGGPEVALRLWGDAWSGSVAPVSAQVKRWEGDFPIGAFVAAGIAAPEAFKAVLRRLGQQQSHPIGERYVRTVEHATVRVASADTPIGPFGLDRLDFVSGGAITSAALFCLLHLPLCSADVRVMEPERLDLSNLNRYLLALLRDAECEAWKVDMLGGWGRPEFAIHGQRLRYSADTRTSVLPFAANVIVGTDDIPTRWVVQREWPAWLAIGATSHFHAIVSAHMPGQACAACLHPEDDAEVQKIPTVSFVSYWAGLLLAVRILRHAAGLDPDETEQYTYCVPLRLDQPHAYWPRPVYRRPDCRLQCSVAL